MNISIKNQNKVIQQVEKAEKLIKELKGVITWDLANIEVEVEENPKNSLKGITIEIGGNADGLNAVIDNVQQKADKLVATLERAGQLANSLNSDN